VQIFITSILRYLPVGFVMEEVAFRGAFDSHLFHPGESRGVLSALFVSALWGIWHIPTIPPGQMPMPIWMLAPVLAGVHCLTGVPLSIFWRRSGNLTVTASTHALIDAVRNAVLGAPA
jgi:membrane protease YdiL (CAAX protease family)